MTRRPLSSFLTASSLCLCAALAGLACRAATLARNVGAPLVVPAGGESYYVFREAGVERRDERGGEPLFAVPGSAGRPSAVGVDAEGGWAAVAYERGLYSVQLAEGRIRPIDGFEWTAPPVAIAVRGSLAAAIEDETIGLYRVADGSREWKAPAGELLERANLDEIHYALPLSLDRLLVVGFRGMSLVSQPETLVLELDRTGGGLSVPRQQPVPAMHWLRACASDGRRLYLAGEHDSAPLGSGRQQTRLEQSLLVVCVDPERLDQVEVVREVLPEGSASVRQLSVGFGLIAVTLGSGELFVYQHTGRSASRALLRERFAGEVTVACIGERHVVVVDGDQSRVLAIPDVVQGAASRSTGGAGAPGPTSNSTQPSAAGTAHTR